MQVLRAITHAEPETKQVVGVTFLKCGCSWSNRNPMNQQQVLNLQMLSQQADQMN
jgi:hypothetical protein